MRHVCASYSFLSGKRPLARHQSHLVPPDPAFRVYPKKVRSLAKNETADRTADTVENAESIRVIKEKGGKFDMRHF